MKPKFKDIFKQARIRGLVYSFIALMGIGYELLFVEKVRLLLVAMYMMVLIIGIVYFRLIKN